MNESIVKKLSALYTTSKRQTKKNDFLDVLIIPDTHDSPTIPSDRFKWIGKCIDYFLLDEVIHIGDLITFDSLCWHIGNETMAGKNKGTFSEDIEHCDKSLDLMFQHMKKYRLLKRNFHLCLGNHENRLFKFEDKNPEIYKLMQKEFFNLLSRYNISWSMYGDFIMRKGVGFTHIPFNARGKEFSGVNAERSSGQQCNMDLVFGHTHRFNYVTVPKIGGNDHQNILNVGTALPDGHIENYAKIGMTGWCYGIALIRLFDKHIQDVYYISMKTLEKLFR